MNALIHHNDIFKKQVFLYRKPVQLIAIYCRHVPRGCEGCRRPPRQFLKWSQTSFKLAKKIDSIFGGTKH